jgi:thiamine-phosphate pyrophosphorylase
MLPELPRLLDANLNRASEGLRVLEDVARFVANDGPLSRELRGMRHALADLARAVDIRLLSARDSVSDVGRESGLRVGGERDLLSVVRANAKRVEESLRVIEEMARLSNSGMTMDAASAERLRYACYDLEKRLSGRVVRVERAARVDGLYVVVDRQAAGDRSLVDLAEQAIAGGASVIQLRDKTSERGQVYREAVELNAVCRERDAVFIMNDYCDIAAAVGAAGLHIGQQDMPLEAVRGVLPLNAIVGVSCEDVEDVRRAVAGGADYIAVGAIFPTLQKVDHVLAGLDVLREARELVGSIPLVAIGGITLQNVVGVIDAGADSVAVIGAVILQPDVRQAAAQMVATIQDAKERGQHGQEPA